jgi:hypothetical protein
MPTPAISKLATTCEYIDRIMTCDLRARPYVLPIYQAAVAHYKQPLSLAAATLLSCAIRGKEHPVVIIITGFASVMVGVGEQDGPVGAAYLARTLAALGVLPVIVTDDHQVDLVRQTFRGGGMNVIDISVARKAVTVRQSVSAIIGWPADAAQAKTLSRETLDDLKPAAIVAIERPGANALGERHHLGGLAMGPSSCSDTDVLWQAARSAGVPCVGIGDGGNELGLGVLRANVEQWLAEYRCSKCGGSVAAVLEADATVFAAVSDWGAYATAAALAASEGRADILPPAETVERAIKACALAGGRNGVNDYTDPGPDNYPWQIQSTVASMMECLVRAAV